MKTYELTYPRDFTHEKAALMLTGLSGIFRHPGKYADPWGRPTLVLEVVGTYDGLHFLLSFPEGMEESIRGHILSVSPAIGIEEVMSEPVKLSYAMRLMRKTENAVKPDPRLGTVLLSSMRGLEPGEMVVAQFVLTSTGNAVEGIEGDPFYVSGRIGVRADEVRGKELISRILVAYRSLQVFKFSPVRKPNGVYRQAPLVVWPAVMSAETLAVVAAIPMDAPVVPGLVLGRGHRFAPEPSIPSVGRVLGMANYLGAQRPVALSVEDRMKHVYLAGPTSSGKSTLIANMVIGDMEDGHGICVIDPGDLVEDLLKRIPPHRVKDVIVYDVGDTVRPIGFNVLAGPNPYTVMSNVLTVFDKIYDLSTTAPRALNLLRPALLSLAAINMTLLEIPRLLEDSPEGRILRNKVIQSVDNPALTDFWHRYEGTGSAGKADQASPILHRLSALLLYPELRLSLGQSTSGFDVDSVLRDNKILLVPLRRGRIGEELSALVASLVLARLWQAAQARPTDERRHFFTYVDEFQHYLNLPVSFAQMAAEARKYRFGLTLSHHHLAQLPPPLRADVMANVRSKIIWQTSAENAAGFAREFGELVTPEDIQGLDRFEALAMLAVQDRVTNPLTMNTFPPSREVSVESVVRAASGRRWGRDKADVEREIQARKHDRLPAPAPLPDMPPDVQAAMHNSWVEEEWE